jgi:hypothetical protein
MSVMIVNRNNVFSNLSKIISLLDAYEEVKISYVASDWSWSSDETSYGWAFKEFKQRDRTFASPRPRSPRQGGFDRGSRETSGELRTSRFAPKSWSGRFGKSRDENDVTPRSYWPKTTKPYSAGGSKFGGEKRVYKKR